MLFAISVNTDWEKKSVKSVSGDSSELSRSARGRLDCAECVFCWCLKILANSGTTGSSLGSWVALPPAFFAFEETVEAGATSVG